MSLSSEQRADMQTDLAIDDSESVFTNIELDRLYERAGEDYNSAVYLGWRQLYADASRLYDYRVAQTEEKRSQIRAGIKEMLDFWQAESRTNANQLLMMGLNGIPNRWKEEPSTEYSDRRRRLLRTCR